MCEHCTFKLPEKQEFPSEEFSKATGIKDLHTDWILPEGHTPESIAKILVEEHGQGLETIKIYSDLVSLNPILGNIIGRTYDICYGVLSKFTYKDIKFFCKFKAPYNKLIKYNESVAGRYKKIYKKTKHHLSFVACPSTLKKIEKELNL